MRHPGRRAARAALLLGLLALPLAGCGLFRPTSPEVGDSGATLLPSYADPESSLKYSYGNLMPSLSAGFSRGHVFYGPSSVQFDSQGRPVQTSGFDYDNFAFRITSDMVFFDGGGNISRINAARFNRDSARERYEYTRDMMAASVIRRSFACFWMRALTQPLGIAKGSRPCSTPDNGATPRSKRSW